MTNGSAADSPVTIPESTPRLQELIGEFLKLPKPGREAAIQELRRQVADQLVIDCIEATLLSPLSHE